MSLVLERHIADAIAAAGYAVVPRKLTPAMRKAFYEAREGGIGVACADSIGGGLHSKSPEIAWNAFLDACEHGPKQPVGTGG